jgi:hypothetical protein
MLGGAAHGERLVRPLGVELVPDGVKARLLLQTIHAGRAVAVNPPLSASA